MANTLRPLFFSTALLFAPALGRAEVTRDNMTQEQAEGIARMVSMPAVEIIRPAVMQVVSNTLHISNAVNWALWDLLNGMTTMQKAGKAPAPDAALVETYIRLRMRCNTGELCRKGGGSCKEYPADREFAMAIQYGLPEVKAYAAGLKGKSPLLKQHRLHIGNSLDTARKRAIFQLRTTGDADRQPTPPAPGEAKYLQLALAKKQGAQFTQPPWP